MYIEQGATYTFLSYVIDVGQVMVDIATHDTPIKRYRVDDIMRSLAARSHTLPPRVARADVTKPGIMGTYDLGNGREFTMLVDGHHRLERLVLSGATHMYCYSVRLEPYLGVIT